jgi:riboflavin transporter FmnP
MKNNKTQKLVMGSILAAFGMILNLIEVPYPIAPWLNFDLSEIVVLVAVSMLGIKSALFVCICKFFISVLVKGPVGPIAIGQITALFASMSIALSYYGLSKVIVTKHKLLDYVLQMLGTMFSLAAVMFVINYLFVTPTYLAGKPIWYTNLPYSVDIMAFNNQYGSTINIPSFLQFLSPYGQAIFIIYFPFNFLKGCLTAVVYYFVKPLEKKYQILT